MSKEVNPAHEMWDCFFFALSTPLAGYVYAKWQQDVVAFVAACILGVVFAFLGLFWWAKR